MTRFALSLFLISLAAAVAAGVAAPGNVRELRAPSTPAGLKVVSASRTTIGLAWRPSHDDGVVVARYAVYVNGVRRATTSSTSYPLAGLSCGNTHVLGVEALDTAGNRSGAAVISATTTSCSDGGASDTTHICSGRSFYVDFAGGSDASSGTSTTAAWKLAPGMTGFAGSYVHRAHDCFYFKGGVTWPNAAFPWTISHGGDAAANDYYGPDYGWSEGLTWARPVFDAGGSTIAGPEDAFVDLSGVAYVTLDNIEMTGFHWATDAPYGTCQYIKTASASHLLFDHLYLHGWTHSDAATDSCYLVDGDTNPPYVADSVFRNGLIDGSDSTNGGDSMAAFYCFPSVEDSIIRYVSNMVLPCHAGTISGNLLEHCVSSFTGGHSNFIETLQGGSIPNGTFSIHDNVIRYGADSCESMFLGNPGETDYVWNNVVYGLTGNTFDLTQNSDAGVAAYYWNNTIVAGDRGEPCLNQRENGTRYSVIEFRNNQCITSAHSAVDSSVAADTLTVDHDILQTPARAAHNGFSAASSYAYSPSRATAATLGAGANLSDDCSGPVAGLCSGTSYACGLQAADHVVLCPDRPLVSARSDDGAWNVGAYDGLSSEQFTRRKSGR